MYGSEVPEYWGRNKDFNSDVGFLNSHKKLESRTTESNYICICGILNLSMLLNVIQCIEYYYSMLLNGSNNIFHPTPSSYNVTLALNI